MGDDKDKWNNVIEYLRSTNADPKSVLNLIKNTWPVKGKKIVKSDDFNVVRRAWTLCVVHGIYNKHGVPKKELKKVKITNQILYFVECEGYRINYNLFHPIVVFNEKLKKKEYNTSDENLYAKKTHLQHAKNCRKLWDSDKGKELRKHFKRTNGKIPVSYRPIFDL
tara:strand:- start:9 stop:506 length:498 start_codon:yes stop_codon:yes gene_type:complete